MHFSCELRAAPSPTPLTSFSFPRHVVNLLPIQLATVKLIMVTSVESHAVPSFYACYLMRSYATSSSSRTYIGSTPDPIRRKKQHNGILTQGAHKTERGRPWETQFIIYGFPSKIAALQVREKERVLANDLDLGLALTILLHLCCSLNGRGRNLICLGIYAHMEIRLMYHPLPSMSPSHYSATHH